MTLTKYLDAESGFRWNVRGGAIGFSIGSKGYMGTGYDGSSSTKDFWEYDPSVNTWTERPISGDCASQRHRFLHREQGLHRDGTI